MAIPKRGATVSRRPETRLQLLPGTPINKCSQALFRRRNQKRFEMKPSSHSPDLFLRTPSLPSATMLLAQRALKDQQKLVPRCTRGQNTVEMHALLGSHIG
ncbi:hypothetical protein P7K49_010316 [Saguinus oedipus]|uniref:Uncharacterized protein n=1 Tax=Saguinus oedipus TaxID=9490 RepID=A0ABQ9VME8_SAGOE|nr:hypothetical protein P7K49_010316 [Saguinus oedipus]